VAPASALPDIALFELGAEDRLRVLTPGFLWPDGVADRPSLFEALPFDLAALVAESFRSGRRTGKPCAFTHALRKGAGPARLLEVMVFPDLAAREGGLCLVQHRMDTREAESFLRTQSDLIERTPMATMRVSVDGCLQYFNAAAAPLVHDLGLRMGDPLGGTFREACELARRSEDRGFDYEVNNRFYRLRALELGQGGGTAGSWLLYGFESTGEKAAEQLVQEQFRRLGSMKSQIVHDINNPLAALVGSAEVALARLAHTPPADPATLMPILERILQAALRIDEILKSLRRPS
jgi:hypothetical protein